MLKLNNHGIGHLLALALLVIGASTFGTYQLVAQRTLIGPKSKSALTVAQVANLEGQARNTTTALQVKSGDIVEFKTTLTNDTDKIILSPVVRTTLPRGLVAINGSLALDGNQTIQLLKSTKINSVVPSGTRTVSFKAMVVTSSKACGTKKLNLTTVISAQKVRAQTLKTALDVCPGGSLVEAPKPELALKYGIQRDGVADQLPIGEAVLGTGEVALYTVSVTNTGNAEAKNVVVKIDGIGNKDLSAVPGSLTIDGKQTTTEVLKRVRLSTIPAKATKTVNFKAKVMTKVQSCPGKNVATTARLTATALPTQSQETLVQICKL